MKNERSPVCIMVYVVKNKEVKLESSNLGSNLDPETNKGSALCIKIEIELHITLHI